MVSAVAAVALWGIWLGAAVWPLSAKTPFAVLALGVLLVPAAGTWLAVGTLREVLDLPARLRAVPGAVRETAAEAASRASGSSTEGRAGRLVGVVGVLWRLRGVVLDTRGSWLRTVALARFARLASLPFALALVAAFGLNFVVIAVAAVVLIGVVL